ncbi:TPA: helix-turn-helix transcriptional regulator [Klebsiella aerogenes]|nr:helix-turn-helix transcriptional regulator [Klebsiella aerogenes]
MDWIESDLSRRMTSAEVGERAGYTRWHLQRLFKQVTGYTLVGYIRGRRMTVASELLRNSSLSISDIHIEVGYDCGATFCHAFKQYFGIPASAFRDSNDDFSFKLMPPLR